MHGPAAVFASVASTTDRALTMMGRGIERRGHRVGQEKDAEGIDLDIKDAMEGHQRFRAELRPLCRIGGLVPMR